MNITNNLFRQCPNTTIVRNDFLHNSNNTLNFVISNFYLYKGKNQYQCLLHSIQRYYIHIIIILKKTILYEDLIKELLIFTFGDEILNEIMHLTYFCHFSSQIFTNKHFSFQLYFNEFQKVLEDNKIHFLNEYFYTQKYFDNRNEFEKYFYCNEFENIYIYDLKQNYFQIIYNRIHYLIECNYFENNTLQDEIQELIQELIHNKKSNDNYYELMFIYFIFKSFNLNEIIIRFIKKNCDILFLNDSDLYNIISYKNYIYDLNKKINKAIDDDEFKSHLLLDIDKQLSNELPNTSTHITFGSFNQRLQRNNNSKMKKIYSFP
jgi:hypothetical protein